MLDRMEAQVRTYVRKVADGTNGYVRKKNALRQADDRYAFANLKYL